MERSWLEEQLGEGRSIESIAREVGRDSSTVAYWVNKFGLQSQHAVRVAARGAVDRATLASLVARGLTIRELAAELDRSPTTVRHWLRRYELVVDRTRTRADPASDEMLRKCQTHGWTWFRRVGSGQLRCPACLGERVSNRRRAVKTILVREAGERCVVCGYDDFAGALQFHHVDPATKRFTISRYSSRSLASLREEAKKCVLLCANCHARVEAGEAILPSPFSPG